MADRIIDFREFPLSPKSEQLGKLLGTSGQLLEFHRNLQEQLFKIAAVCMAHYEVGLDERGLRGYADSAGDWIMTVVKSADWTVPGAQRLTPRLQCMDEREWFKTVVASIHC